MKKPKTEISELERIAGREISPELFAELMKKYPDMARSAHLLLAHEEPHLYAEIIPDIFDAQTSLFSKSYFEEALLEESINRANNGEFVFCYGILDLDNFRKVNELYGHICGDNALLAVSKKIHENLRTHKRREEPAEPAAEAQKAENKRISKDRREEGAYDLLGYSGGRIGGGEEFGLILPGCNYEGAFKVLERVRESVAGLEIPDNHGRCFNVTVSGGFTQYAMGMSKTELIERADYALMNAKKQPGKNTIRWAFITLLD